MSAKRRPKGIAKVDWDAVASPPLTAAQLKKMRPAAAVLPRVVEAYRRSRGRPKAAQTKELVSLRLDAQVLKAFKSEGPGWQTRMNDVLAGWAKRKAQA